MTTMIKDTNMSEKEIGQVTEKIDQITETINNISEFKPVVLIQSMINCTESIDEDMDCNYSKLQDKKSAKGTPNEISKRGYKDINGDMFQQIEKRHFLKEKHKMSKYMHNKAEGSYLKTYECIFKNKKFLFTKEIIIKSTDYGLIDSRLDLFSSISNDENESFNVYKKYKDHKQHPWLIEIETVAICIRYENTIILIGCAESKSDMSVKDIEKILKKQSEHKIDTLDYNTNVKDKKDEEIDTDKKNDEIDTKIDCKTTDTKTDIENKTTVTKINIHPKNCTNKEIEKTVLHALNVLSGQKPWEEDEKLQRDIGNKSHHSSFTHKNHTKSIYKPRKEIARRNNIRHNSNNNQ